MKDPKGFLNLTGTNPEEERSLLETPPFGRRGSPL
jgi:hypothetical protein